MASAEEVRLPVATETLLGVRLLEHLLPLVREAKQPPEDG